MTLSEFKAWFEGFTECMEGAPDESQWKRIQARVKEIDGVAITKTVFVDRYVSPWRPYWTGLDCYSGMETGNVALLAGKTSSESFNSHSALMDLGKAEYSAALSPRAA